MTEKLKSLKGLNPHIPLFSAADAEFGRYGCVRGDIDTAAFIRAAADIPLPSDGSAYVPALPAFEQLAAADAVRDRFFGKMPCQLGYCFGHNSRMDAMEWHTGNELDIALTDLVLILAKRADLTDGRLDSSRCLAFYVPQGTAVEIYADTLHYCPCETERGGFRMVVGLPAGTNTPSDAASSDPRLFAKSKWLLAHRDNAALIRDGAVPGIDGENLTIKYE